MAMPTGHRSAPVRSGTSRACGTFGELLQGVLAEDDLDFLVTLPIACWSVAEFRWDPLAEGIAVRPAHKTKAARLAGAMLDEFGIPGGGTLTVDSEVPEGKGLASSSADLVATGRAVGAALDLPASGPVLERLLRRIEPSDGVMYPGVVSFYHREVRLRERFGFPPPLTVVGIDEGGEVDTVAFNRIPKPFTETDKREYGRLLELLGRALRERDVVTIGEVSERSAVLNQALRPKRLLAEMRAIRAEVGGLGVVAAHSGTTLGVLLAEDDPLYHHKLDHARELCRVAAGSAQIYRSLTAEPRTADSTLTAMEATRA